MVKPFEVPGLKKPVVPSPDSSLPDTLLDLGFQRANVLCSSSRSRAPQSSSDDLESSKKSTNKSDKQLGISSTAPNIAAARRAVGPDKS